ncbi:hypothetical protein PN36_31130 [Candidatus Thiomargarita nelsonii]|uniref:Uncharacterized protein n=1 Tax=Candidatus Thiomargarita nelsonii TaxID=1003181 RepID=A0A4E0QWZ0_9GAMM|nr:hypothetical protein PN36_31130 [Candidatus Thiomargarita nelsonii]
MENSQKQFKFIEGLTATQPIVVNNQDRQDYLQALSKYDCSVPELNKKTTRLLIENPAFERLKNLYLKQALK